MEIIGSSMTQQREGEAFRLPGTSIRFGPFTYFSPMDEELGVPKWGFLRDDGRFFYLNEPFAQSGDSQYALTGSYFIVDGGAGGSGICRTMYLFRHDRDSMRLLDMIEETYNDFSPPPFSNPTIRERLITVKDRLLLSGGIHSFQVFSRRA